MEVRPRDLKLFDYRIRNANHASSEILLEWSSTALADTHKIIISTDPQFRSVLKTIPSNRSELVIHLANGKKYFWKVEAWSKNLMITSSKALSIDLQFIHKKINAKMREVKLGLAQGFNSLEHETTSAAAALNAKGHGLGPLLGFYYPTKLFDYDFSYEQISGNFSYKNEKLPYSYSRYHFFVHYKQSLMPRLKLAIGLNSLPKLAIQTVNQTSSVIAQNEFYLSHLVAYKFDFKKLNTNLGLIGGGQYRSPFTTLYLSPFLEINWPFRGGHSLGVKSDYLHLLTPLEFDGLEDTGTAANNIITSRLIYSYYF